MRARLSSNLWLPFASKEPDPSIFPVRPGDTNRLLPLVREWASRPTIAGTHPLLYGYYASGGTWEPAAHLVVLSMLVFGASMGWDGTRRMQVSMPPRHGKSYFTSWYAPAWLLGAFPEKRVMLTSYGQEYAESWGMRAEETFMSTYDAVWPWLRGVHPRHKSADWWWLNGEDGYMTCAGVGGIITGKGADAFLADDLVKSQAEADSERLRDVTFEWLQGTALTRIEPGGWALLLGTRWHFDDVMQRALDWAVAHKDEGSPPYTILNLPAIAEQDEVFYAPWDDKRITPLWVRKAGEPLWPERWGLTDLQALKGERHPRIWSAQYQGNPTQKGGDLFKSDYFRYFERKVYQGENADVGYFELAGKLVAERDCYTFATMDVAGTVKTTSDYTVIGIWTVTPDRDILLRYIDRFRNEVPDLPAQVQRNFDNWLLTYMGIEDKTFGTGLIQEMVRRGLSIMPLKANVDKIARALPMSLAYLHGRVWHPLNREANPWLELYERELLAFPNGVYDDQVDVASYAGQLVMGSERPRVIDLDTNPAPQEQPTREEAAFAYRLRVLREDDWE